MHVVVRTDDRHAKSVLDSLRMRRGEIHARTHEPDQDVITARVPLSELFGFEGQLRAETHGHASCSIRFADYQPVVQGPAGDDDHTSRVGALEISAVGSIDAECDELHRAIIATNRCACWSASSLARPRVNGSSGKSRRNERHHPR
jgi:translation elongation factor EF-G